MKKPNVVKLIALYYVYIRCNRTIQQIAITNVDIFVK